MVKKIPAMTKGYDAMDIDNEYSVEDFATEIAALGDGEDDEDECVFPGYCRPMQTTWSKEEDGPLYRMEVLTSEVEALMSTPSKASKKFLLSEDDTEETLIARRIMVKAKAKKGVGGRGRQGVEVKIIIGDPKATVQRKKTKGMLL